MRVVLDANVLVSAVISSRGSPGKILDLWKKDRFELVFSSPILEELERIIHYPRIQQRYKLPEEYIEQFLSLIGSQGISVNPSMEIYAIERDPSDNRYLECALEGEASYLVTGDHHLLELKEYQGVVILPPAGFLVMLEVGGEV
jgi:putative PIN family toxin of toxin-antitoxin system